MSKVKFITVSELYNICKENRYILLRMPYDQLMAVNCKVADLAIKKKNYKPTDETSFISYKPCELHEYIQHKTTFL